MIVDVEGAGQVVAGTAADKSGNTATASVTVNLDKTNPVVTAAARHLWGNPNPSATIQAWPMQHPVAASLLWSVALLVIFAPLATLLYRRRTTG